MLRSVFGCSIACSAIVVAACVALFSPQATAAPPARDEVLRVIDYFNNGKGAGPVLLELTPCLKVEKPKDEKKKRCVEPITKPIARRTTAYVFLRFVVPRDDKYDDIVVEWSRDGKVVGESAVAIATSWSYGVWKARSLTRAGKWTVSVKRGTEVLGSAELVVE